ncbi:glutathione S-transferase [Leucothrix arctica]|uniref:Glutathione S-transferase n=1 Tax=Leucothrix arctica TaxID=1481894 RepID=A0A317CG65_9GAMM|nr:glutathione S-transferase [Leucothrix arctica]PWQ97548.1 glutathione S-transferase [Leucothrix arctica]
MKPILYSFRRCPYAMRARLAIVYAGQQVELREVVLRDKPEQMLALSPKGTVPVLQLAEGGLLEESLDIALWALRLNDPQQLLADENQLAEMLVMVKENDGEFKDNLDRYKYANRFPEQSETDYRQQGELFIAKLEQRLAATTYLFGSKPSFADIAIMPFVRQFAHVDKRWFDEADYPAVQRWLSHWLASEMFLSIMPKYEQWQESHDAVTFPNTESQ